MEGKSDLRQRDVGNGKLENGISVSENDVANTDKDAGTCSRLRKTVVNLCSPCLISRHPLPENASTGQKFVDAFRFPPHGCLATYLRFGLVCLQIWVILYTLTHGLALPGGNFFSLLILFVCCVVGGYLISFARLPPLLGMLIVGVLLRNIPVVSTIGENIDTRWSSVLKNVALTVILTRAGLGLDVIKLRKLSWAVLRLAWMPCLLEIITGAIVSRYLLGFPWTWSWMLGCILGALSPAVTVPSLVNLQDRRYGVDKGIPTMLLAAGGLDNVLCITGFSVFLGIIFSEGDLAITIIKGPLGALAGIVYGFVMGTLLWYIPAKDSANPVFYRSLMLFLSGMIAIFGSSEVGLAGAGPLGCLTTATVASYKWRQRRKPGETDEVSAVMGLAWLIVQHFLFGLIGSAVDISNIKSNTAGLGIATLAIGLVVRSIVSYTVTLGTGFNQKERIFIVLTWLSKATVQAAIGGLALDRVTLMDNPDPEHVRLATDILTIAVLAIIICAPTGATLMAIFGPRFLHKSEDDEVQLQVVIHGEKSPVNIKPPQQQDIKQTSSIELQMSDEMKNNLGFALTPLNKEKEQLYVEGETIKTGIVNPCFEDEPVTIDDDNKAKNIFDSPNSFVDLDTSMQDDNIIDLDSPSMINDISAVLDGKTDMAHDVAHDISQTRDGISGIDAPSVHIDESAGAKFDTTHKEAIDISQPNNVGTDVDSPTASTDAIVDSQVDATHCIDINSSSTNNDVADLESPSERMGAKVDGKPDVHVTHEVSVDISPENHDVAETVASSDNKTVTSLPMDGKLSSAQDIVAQNVPQNEIVVTNIDKDEDGTDVDQIAYTETKGIYRTVVDVRLSKSDDEKMSHDDGNNNNTG